MITIKPLTACGIVTIHHAFVAAFADYAEPFTLASEELQYRIERRGYRADLSFGAFDGDSLIGFTLNGVGVWNGQPTAYDTGTGVMKEYHQQGIAASIFDFSLPVLRENGIKHYLLEVIKTNVKAYELYHKAGFAVSREFDYFLATVLFHHLLRHCQPKTLKIINVWIDFLPAKEFANHLQFTPGYGQYELIKEI